MKITIIGPTYPYRGGISHYTTLLCKALRKNHEVQFISYSRQYPAFLFPGTIDRDPSAKPLQIDEVEYIIDSVNPLTWLKSVGRIRVFNPDLLIIPWWVVFWIPQYYLIIKMVKKKTGARVIFLCHNVVEHEANFLKARVSKFILGLGDRIFTHSEEETGKAKKLLGSFAPVETAFHPTYVDLGIELHDKYTARNDLELNSNYVLLFFGFIRPYKGLDILLEALPRILAARKDATLLVAGEFWESKEAYQKQIDRLGIKDHVVLVDKYLPNEEVGLYFAAADLVVQPYRAVTGSGICQLAYGLNRPVIASNCGSLAEVIRDGVNGRLVEPGDVNGLSLAVIDSLAPETLNRLNAGAAQTKLRFSWERLATIITRGL